MVIDTSAAVAVFLREPERALYLDLILRSDVRLLSAVSYAEISMVLEGRRGAAAERELDDFLLEAGIEVVAVTPADARTALAAWRKFGKGRHPAKLNLGECFSYALAQSAGEPLLAKGDDFPRTDVPLCWSSGPSQ